MTGPFGQPQQTEGFSLAGIQASGNRIEMLEDGRTA
jgi:hypothetical protein